MSQAYVGEIRVVGFNFAPRGWALANGATLPINQYSAVFSLLGTTFGGNGTTTFQLPDLRSRSPLGFGQGTGLSNFNLGQNGGTETVSLTIPQMPMHNHNVTGTLSVTTTVGVYNAVANKLSPQGTVLAVSETNVAPATSVKTYSDQTPNGTLGGVTSTATSGLTTAQTGGNLPVPIRSPYLALNYVIVLSGIFPSRN